VEASSPRKNMENIGKMKMMKYDENDAKQNVSNRKKTL
jgi:hypothetical protein